jgi:D-tyrosyl-tRNA(Tyr) deacylase
MRAVVQRVSHARVSVGGETVGEIGAGLCVLLSVGPGDTEAIADHLAERVARLRVHPDQGGRMNLDLERSGGSILVVSQFTLHADTTRGHRPSFLGAAPPELARDLCDHFIEAIRALGVPVAAGRFGAHMEVEIVNDGPVTLVLSAGEGPWVADAG